MADRAKPGPTEKLALSQKLFAHFARAIGEESKIVDGDDAPTAVGRLVTGWNGDGNETIRIAFRFGACAVAEFLMQNAMEIVERAGENEGAKIVAAVIALRADEVFKAVGIDPERWEEARNA